MEDPWAKIAAENLIDILPFMVETGEEIPTASAADIARRIEKVFQDRLTWNTTIHESGLQWFLKVWLIVP